MNRRIVLQAAGLAAAALLGAGTVQAQAFPTKSITLVVPNPPGGVVDTAARLASDPLSRLLGQSVVVDNRGGGIFDHLPIADHPRAFEPHFVTAQGADIGPICRGAGVPCHRLDDPRALETWLADASEAPLAVAHVPIDRADDLRRHHAAWDAIARAIDVPPTRTASSHPPMRSTP